MKDIKGLKESLIYGINTSDKVIIIPHVNPDFDAIGSALGLAVIAKKYKKDVYIIVWVSVKKILDKKKQKMLITFSAFLLKNKVNTSKI